MMMVSKSLNNKANLFPIQASMLPQKVAKTSAFQVSGQDTKEVISRNDELNYSGLTIGQQANSKQMTPHLSQAVSPLIENKPEKFIAPTTSPTALSNSPWPIPYLNSVASEIPLNPQQLSTTQTTSYLNQTQATSALPFTGSITGSMPKENNPLLTNNLDFPNFWNPLDFQYPDLHRNVPSAAMQIGMSPILTGWPINSYATPFSNPFKLNLAGDANRLQYLRRNLPTTEKQSTEKTAPAGFLNSIHQIIQGIAKSCGCYSFTEKTVAPTVTKLSTQSSDANSYLLNNGGYDRTTIIK